MNKDRQRAIDTKEKTYNGKPCIQCQETLKYVSGYSCVRCSVARNMHKLFDVELMAQYRTKDKQNANRRRSTERTKRNQRKYRNKSTSKERMHNYYMMNRVNKRRADLKKYNLTLEKYNDLLEQQNGVCAICNVDQCSTGKSFAVDHSHSENQIRGLLCKNCNIGLGMFFDRADLLQKAADYLQKYHS